MGKRRKYAEIDKIETCRVIGNILRVMHILDVQKETIAKLTGWSPSTVSAILPNIEKDPVDGNIRSIKLDDIHAIVRIMDIPIQIIFSEIDDLSNSDIKILLTTWKGVMKFKMEDRLMIMQLGIEAYRSHKSFLERKATKKNVIDLFEL